MLREIVQFKFLTDWNGHSPLSANANYFTVRLSRIRLGGTSIALVYSIIIHFAKPLFILALGSTDRQSN